MEKKKNGKGAEPNPFQEARRQGKSAEAVAYAMTETLASTIAAFMHAYSREEFSDRLLRSRVEALAVNIGDARDAFGRALQEPLDMLAALAKSGLAEVQVLGIPDEGLPDELRAALRELGVPESMLGPKDEPEKGGGDEHN